MKENPTSGDDWLREYQREQQERFAEHAKGDGRSWGLHGDWAFQAESDVRKALRSADHDIDRVLKRDPAAVRSSYSPMGRAQNWTSPDWHAVLIGTESGIGDPFQDPHVHEAFDRAVEILNSDPFYKGAFSWSWESINPGVHVFRMTPIELSKNPGHKFKVGDIVRRTAAAMRSMGIVSGPINGMVVGYSGRWPLIMWSDMDEDEEPMAQAEEGLELDKRAMAAAKKNPVHPYQRDYSQDIRCLAKSPKLGDKYVLGTYAAESRVQLAEWDFPSYNKAGELMPGDWVTVVRNGTSVGGNVTVKVDRNKATVEKDGLTPLWETDVLQSQPAYPKRRCWGEGARAPKENPAWVTKILAKHFVDLEETVPPKWLPKLTKPTTERGKIVAAMKELGCGAYGCVLPVIDPTVVLKLTTDSTEAEFAHDLSSKLSKPVVVKYHLTRALPDRYRGLQTFLLWRDSADQVGEILQAVAARGGDVKRADRAITKQHKAAQKAFDAMHKGKPAEKLIEDWVAAAKEMGEEIPELSELADDMIEVLRKDKVFFGDVHDGNLGLVDGRWVIVDPGHVAKLLT